MAPTHQDQLAQLERWFRSDRIQFHLNLPPTDPDGTLRTAFVLRAMKQAKGGGPYLGAVRGWIQTTFRGGDQVQWGSNEVVGEVTVHMLEELALRVHDAVVNDLGGQLEQAVADVRKMGTEQDRR